MSERRQLTESEIASLTLKHPELPAEYFHYLSAYGYGETESGRMIYSAPINPADIYPRFQNRDRIVLLGDDFQGYCFGYNFDLQKYGEVSQAGIWETLDEVNGFSSYVG
jgi:hypothetical protein